MTSTTKPDVHNIITNNQMRTEHRHRIVIFMMSMGRSHIATDYMHTKWTKCVGVVASYAGEKVNRNTRAIIVGTYSFSTHYPSYTEFITFNDV